MKHTPESVLELAHGTYSMRDELANDYLIQQDELIRLRGEVERQQKVIERLNNSLTSGAHYFWHWKARAETAEARVRQLETAVVQLQVDNDQCFGILQGTEARVKELVSERDRAVKAYTDEAQAHDVTRAQLAELRARVRPSVEEIILADINGLRIHYGHKPIVSLDEMPEENLSDWIACAQSIHAILPPVPKVLSVDELHKMIRDHEFYDDDWQDVSKEMAKSIHKAMGGEG